ncbi:hypothetical protein BJP34_11110 [Moorena producens PAL-8-15-08-1]|uniref:DUF4437 domain-containing protein n=1 Tax=Moorena producens PAL-8-15-08-1 TaxID=1458985 RepID=A0A1D8TQJ5_9CYAN|nr:hypothetical protein BJP34_11110 [Moorena producens PAL-8-15-08-1]
MRRFLALALTSLVIAACTSSLVPSESITPKSAAEPSPKVVLTSEVKWEQLNPARGDKSPQAGTLWGDRTGPGAAGFLLKPADGFKSPPHIHNIAYRGVVISGLIHNGHPNAEEIYMPGSSFWTQPAGGVHITAAKGNNSLAYIEVEDSFGVLPAEKAFHSEEKPINVDASNIVWIDQPRMPASANGPKLAFLWGNPQDDQLNGTLVKLPAKFTGKILSHGSTFRAVVIQGQAQYQVPSETDVKTLVPGSYFSSKGESEHQVSSKTGEESIIYIRTDGKFEVI